MFCSCVFSLFSSAIHGEVLVASSAAPGSIEATVVEAAGRKRPSRPEVQQPRTFPQALPSARRRPLELVTITQDANAATRLLQTSPRPVRILGIAPSTWPGADPGTAGGRDSKRQSVNTWRLLQLLGFVRDLVAHGRNDTVVIAFDAQHTVHLGCSRDLVRAFTALRRPLFFGIDPARRNSKAGRRNALLNKVAAAAARNERRLPPCRVGQDEHMPCRARRDADVRSPQSRGRSFDLGCWGGRAWAIEKALSQMDEEEPASNHYAAWASYVTQHQNEVAFDHGGAICLHLRHLNLKRDLWRRQACDADDDGVHIGKAESDVMRSQGIISRLRRCALPTRTAYATTIEKDVCFARAPASRQGNQKLNDALRVVGAARAQTQRFGPSAFVRLRFDQLTRPAPESMVVEALTESWHDASKCSAWQPLRNMAPAAWWDSTAWAPPKYIDVDSLLTLPGHRCSVTDALANAFSSVEDCRAGSAHASSVQQESKSWREYQRIVRAWHRLHKPIADTTYELFVEDLLNLGDEIPEALAAAGTMAAMRSETIADTNAAANFAWKGTRLLHRAAFLRNPEAASNLAVILREQNRPEDADAAMKLAMLPSICSQMMATWEKKCMYHAHYDHRLASKMLIDRHVAKIYATSHGTDVARELLAPAQDPSTLQLWKLQNCSFRLRWSHGAGSHDLHGHGAVEVQWFRTPSQRIKVGGYHAALTEADMMTMLRLMLGTKLHPATPTVLVEEPLKGKLYGWHCFSGSCPVVEFRAEDSKRRGTKPFCRFYTDAWIPFGEVQTSSPKGESLRTIPRPRRLSQMRDKAMLLSARLDYARVDLREVSDRVVFETYEFEPDGCRETGTPHYPGLSSYLAQRWVVRVGPCANVNTM